MECCQAFLLPGPYHLLYICSPMPSDPHQRTYLILQPPTAKKHYRQLPLPLNVCPSIMILLSNCPSFPSIKGPFHSIILYPFFIFFNLNFFTSLKYTRISIYLCFYLYHMGNGMNFY